MANELAPSNVLPFCLAPREGRRSGCTLTVVNDDTGGRVTVRFRKPKGFKSVLVDVMTGSDNETDFAFAGTLRGTELALSPKAKCPKERALFAKKVLDWTLRAAEAGDLRTVRCLHEGRCARCGRKLTVPESIDSGLGPECRSKKVA